MSKLIPVYRVKNILARQKFEKTASPPKNMLAEALA
jgi:hypothetical protein